MANYVVLDTSIYRELGLKFNENLDYKNLCAFTMNTDGEVLLSDIVLEEFSNYYESVLNYKTSAYIKANKDLVRDPYFNSPNEIESGVKKELDKAIKNFRDTLQKDPIHNHNISVLRPTLISGLVLTKFILDSKETKDSNIQIRDYLIWDSVLNFAKEENEDRITKIGCRKITFNKSIVTFITKDKGFGKNEIFQNLLREYKIDNLEVINSIPEFLERKGFYFDFVTSELIKEKITFNRILKDLSKDIGALLSYVSERYNSNCYDKKIEESEIEKVEVLEHYTYIDSNDNKHKFTANLKVWVRVVFEKDENGYKESLKIEESRWRSLETYDEQKRPYFQKPIMFFYGGLVNLDRKSIKSIRFLDYIPDMYLDE
ncbi:PIN domain-containing protein [Zobellia alginiliquefaciens]|uniref:PIN domain-containing protein n=1 Tax=Zobellia alginiliquefaciens TaxID=3032586 RepID=UPI0023E3918D|nr:PIN domain-containing protein [Zobellia alginiliquefaciens]